MAHFAQLNENNVVTNVIVVSNVETSDANGVENETIGVAFCKKLFGANTQWVQTSYNSNMRKHFAGIGYTYDAQRDAFVPPKPFNSWILNEDTCTWQAPVPFPEDAGTGDPAKIYSWDEDTINWVLVV